MSKYQIWSRDEYGQGSIIETYDNVDDAVKRGKEEVTNVNVSNALTADDRVRNWEAYMVNIVVEDDETQYVYGGPHAKAANTIYVFDGEDEDTVKLSDIEDAVVRIYLGNISVNRHEEEDWFACDVARRIIEGIDHQDLDGKMMYFVKKI